MDFSRLSLEDFPPIHSSRLSLADWLRLHSYMSSSAGLRGLWLEQVCARELVPKVLDTTPASHSLNPFEVRELLARLAPGRSAGGYEWCTFLVGASPELAVEMLRDYLPQPWSATITEPLPLSVRRAMVANPRLLRSHVQPLVDERRLPPFILNDMHTAPPGPHELGDSPLGRQLSEQFGDDVGAWRLFFELWDGGEVSEAADTVRATL